MKKSRIVALALVSSALAGTAAVLAQAGPGGHDGSGKRFAMLKLQQADLDDDGVVTRAELGKARQQRFARMDANGDGKVDATELDAAIMKRLERKKVRIRYRMLGRLDANGDGTIDRQEFLQAGERLFARLDADGDGKLTRQEMNRGRRHAMMGGMGMSGGMGMMGQGGMSPAMMQQMHRMHMQMMQGGMMGGAGMMSGAGTGMQHGRQGGQPRHMRQQSGQPQAR